MFFALLHCFDWKNLGRFAVAITIILRASNLSHHTIRMVVFLMENVIFPLTPPGLWLAEREQVPSPIGRHGHVQTSTRIIRITPSQFVSIKNYFCHVAPFPDGQSCRFCLDQMPATHPLHELLTLCTDPCLRRGRSAGIILYLSTQISIRTRSVLSQRTDQK